MMKNLMEKMKSYSFWTALAGASVLLVESICKLFGVSIKGELISNVILGIASILVVFGIVTMPASKNDKKDENEKIDE